MLLTKLNGKIAFLSTYPPRECGLATFTQDLITAIDQLSLIDTGVIAINNSQKYRYDSKVIAEIKQYEKKDYIRIANELNDSDVDLLVIEHEYGIFGGKYGDYILDMVYNVKIPVVTTLHTIQSEPDMKHRKIIEALGRMSEKIITMAKNTKQILQTVYKVDPDKIQVIHHGVPKMLFEPRESLKEKYGYENRRIISTFGLLGPGKGLEHGIEAVAKVIRDHRDVLYLILGQTHPALGEAGVSYRKMLEDLVDKLDLKANVKFINKYLSKEEIIQYLQLSDIYMTPYLNKDQAVSGTMAYAAGYGKAIVSTPYLYAQEMLSNGRGLLAQFNNPDSLAGCINTILLEPDKQAIMERETMKIGRTMYWDKIAKQYIEVFLKIIQPVPEIRAV
jgi:glycosyltransferase involved in cell wall biosynthesis